MKQGNLNYVVLPNSITVVCFYSVVIAYYICQIFQTHFPIMYPTEFYTFNNFSVIGYMKVYYRQTLLWTASRPDKHYTSLGQQEGGRHRDNLQLQNIIQVSYVEEVIYVTLRRHYFMRFHMLEIVRKFFKIIVRGRHSAEYAHVTFFFSFKSYMIKNY